MTNQLAASTMGTPTVEEWLTVTNLVLIAIGIGLAIAVILWGARLKRRRAAVEQIIEDRAEDAPASPTLHSLDQTPPPAPETEAMIAPAVAPAPPPLAGDDTPVVATAPFDAAPATIAAELATPPEPVSHTAPSPEPVADVAPPPPAAAGVASDTTGDDLTQMKGVGPKLAARLRELGITRYAQIAALAPDEARALDAQLGSFQGRMARDRWVEQAGYLAVGDRAGFEAMFGRL